MMVDTPQSITNGLATDFVYKYGSAGLTPASRASQIELVSSLRRSFLAYCYGAYIALVPRFEQTKCLQLYVKKR